MNSTSSQRVERVRLDLVPPRMARDDDPTPVANPARSRGLRGPG